jgi:hypothetical protein
MLSCGWFMTAISPNIMRKEFLCGLFVFAANLILQAPVEAEPQADADWFVEGIHAPEGLTGRSAKRPIVIAIVDDGVRTSHQDLQGLIWSNRKEIPANGIDDDGNGYVDDVHGWDVADANNSVTPPDDRLDEFYHGTHLAGIVSRIARRAYGDDVAGRIQIMPVKTLSDRAQRAYLKDGYRGIAYATQADADIILSAWGMAYISADESQILREADEKGILVVSSAGNFSQGQEQYPAAEDVVLAVAALDQADRKTEKSNFGLFVDLAAPGIDILSASSRSDTDYETRDGTSQSAAIAAVAAAIVKQQHPDYSWMEVTACLKQSADPIDDVNPRYTASLGAGKLNLDAAVACDFLSGDDERQVALVNPQGYLHFDRRRGKTATWKIAPRGEFKGLRFRPQVIDRKAARGTMTFFAGPDASAPMVASYSLAELPESVYVAGTTAHVSFNSAGRRRSSNWLLDYRAEPIDFTRLYCSDTKELNVEGVIDDGSGPNDYCYHSNCKWLITAPEGKRIHIRFTEFDTQSQTDKVYFFDGAGTHENIMAIFSGPAIPPELTTWRNQVLVWFVSDSEQQGKGWRAEYRFVDPT